MKIYNPLVKDKVPLILRYEKIAHWYSCGSTALEQKGLAYQTPDGSVYFDVKKYGKYGVFSSPVEVNQESESGKKCVLDFALWKANKPGEPWWESPWGKGRPGWHVECSAMASCVFGSHFDLHSGGEDLLYPHHENELAQSCGYHGNDQWVNYWIHTGHLFLAGQGDKMSKSLKNVISIPELLEKYTSNQFRMLCLLTHYRRKLEFSDERMDKAISTLNTLYSLLNRCDLLLKGQLKCKNIPEAEFYEKLHSTRTLIKNALADDFNTPQALAHLMRFIKFINQYLGENRTSDSQESATEGHNLGPIVSAGVFLRNLLETFGLEISDKVQSAEASSVLQQQFHKAVDSVITTRSRLREFVKNKQFVIESADQLNISEDKAVELMKILYKPLWAMTDQMRADLLTNSDIMIQDSSSGSTWYKVESKTKKDNNKADLKENSAKSNKNESPGKKIKNAAKAQDKEENT
ncbi:Cysteine--tRNA ligase, mitochondrial [Bulinus truncatus]|nr:Cysteine--tRNA ligase, mitochondrial [Bulinus truncatus]